MSKGQILHPLFNNESRVHDYYYDQETDMIYFRKSIEGKIIKFSTGVKRPNILGAKRFANSALRKKLNKRKNNISTLISDELISFQKVKDSENWKADSNKNIRNGIKQIKAFWGDKFPSEITADNIPLWFEWFKKEYPGQQKENAIKVMRMFTKYLGKKMVNGLPLLISVPTITDPDRKELLAHRQKRKERVFEGDDFKRVYDSGLDEAEKLVVLFMYLMATRIDETLKLRFGYEILLDQEPPVYQWTVGQNKADLVGRHAIHESLIEPLRKLREQRKVEGTPYLFPSRTDIAKPSYEQMIDWASWRDRAKIGWHWTTHTCRRSCLTDLFADENNPQILICKLYRVSLAVAFEHYIKTTKTGILKMQNAKKVSL